MLKQTMACAAMVALLACGDDDVVGGSGGTSGVSAGTGAVSGSGGAAGTGGIGGTAGVSGTGGSGGISGTGGLGGTGGDGGVGGGAVSSRPNNRIDTRDRSVCAIRSDDDRIECWGSGLSLYGAGAVKRFGYDGWSCWLDLNGYPVCDEPTMGSMGPAEPMTDLAISSTGVGRTHACAITLQGTLSCWSPMQLLDAVSGVAVLDVDGGKGGVCRVLAADGSIECSDSSLGTVNARLAGAFSQVATGLNHIAGLEADGTVIYNTAMGARLNLPPSTRPGPYVQVAAGWDFLCGIRPDGEAECWADNADDAALIEAPPPGPYEELAMDRYACGIRSRGDVVCWRGPSAVEAFAAPPQGFVAKTGP